VDLLFGSHHVQRDIWAPACRARRRKRRALDLMIGLGPPVGLLACLLLPLALPSLRFIKGAPLGVLAGLTVLLWIVLRNRGGEPGR